MAFDPVNRSLMLFGGFLRGEVFGDAWHWNGEAWRKDAATGPRPRANHALATHREKKLVLLFGGWTPQLDKQLGDTWAWDGTSWSELTQAGPTPREMSAMTYDPATAGLLLHGGRSDTGRALGETWYWNGTWSQQPAAAPP